MHTLEPGPSQVVTQLITQLHRGGWAQKRAGRKAEEGSPLRQDLSALHRPPLPNTSGPLLTENVAQIVRRKLLEHALREKWRQAATAAPSLGSYSHVEKQRGTTLFRTSSVPRTLLLQVGDASSLPLSCWAPA